MLTTLLIVCVVTGYSQVKHKLPVNKSVKKHPSYQLKEFMNLVAEADAQFIFPKEMKEVAVLNNEDFSFDYAMELPGYDFQVWFQVRSLKPDWKNYRLYSTDISKRTDNPDSLYNKMGRAQAIAFTGDPNFVVRTIPTEILARYNADAGKTYFLNLQDMSETKHYKYALLITLEKDHEGTILAVCFCNDKGPEFFRNINKIGKCLKFKP